MSPRASRLARSAAPNPRKSSGRPFTGPTGPTGPTAATALLARGARARDPDRAGRARAGVRPRERRARCADRMHHQDRRSGYSVNFPSHSCTGARTSFQVHFWCLACKFSGDFGSGWLAQLGFPGQQQAPDWIDDDTRSQCRPSNQQRKQHVAPVRQRDPNSAFQAAEPQRGFDDRPPLGAARCVLDLNVVPHQDTYRHRPGPAPGTAWQRQFQDWPMVGAVGGCDRLHPRHVQGRRSGPGVDFRTQPLDPEIR
jgi:hypothetical protein